MGVGAVRRGGKGFLLGTALIFLGYLFLARIFGGSGPPPVFAEKVTLESAAASARQSGKPVLALASADWCPPCRQLEAGALRDAGVETWIRQNTHAVFLDFTEPQGELGERLNVTALPTMLLMRDGKEISRQEGLMDKTALLAWLGAFSGPLEDWKAGHPGQEPPRIAKNHGAGDQPAPGSAHGAK